MSDIEEKKKRKKKRKVKKKKAKTDYSKEKKDGLHGWFSRQGGKGKSKGWVDCNTCRKDKKTGRKKCSPCGRSGKEKRSKYPSCRPTPGACGNHVHKVVVKCRQSSVALKAYIPILALGKVVAA